MRQVLVVAPQVEIIDGEPVSEEDREAAVPRPFKYQYYITILSIN